jgi:hypothetical protein
MAEKELRIAIYKTDKQVVEGNYGDFYNTMTRAEAIERIAKEIARQYDPRKPNKEEYEKVWKQELFPATKKYYLKQAECVLNALLEGK